jgi:hypothetical protein
VKFTQKSKRKNNFLALMQSMVILASMVGSLFANISFAGTAMSAMAISNQGNSSAAQSVAGQNSFAENSASQNSFIQNLSARNLYISSGQVRAVYSSATNNNSREVQSSFVQKAIAVPISPTYEITLQQSEAVQKNVSGGQLSASASAALLNESASLTDVAALSVEAASSTLTLNSVPGQLSGQNLILLSFSFAPTPIFIPFTFNSSAPQQTQAIISGNARQQKLSAADNAKEFNLFNTGSAKTQIAAQNNSIIFSANTVEILRC